MDDISTPSVVELHYLVEGSPRKLAKGASMRLSCIYENKRYEHCTKGRVYAVAVSPDGSIIASGGDDQLIHLWDLATGQCFKTLAGTY